MKPTSSGPSRTERWKGDKEAKDPRNVSLRTVERLSAYRKTLEELYQEGVEHIYSRQLARMLGVTSAQLRKDLSLFGSFGTVSRGYNIEQMIATISSLLGTDELQQVALVGLGNLGKTLLTYRGFAERGFIISVAFENDPKKVGRIFAGRRCHHIDDLEAVVKEFGVSIAMLACRATGLQDLVKRLGACGVKSILNFVPKTVVAPVGVFVENVDIAAKLEKLSYLKRHNHLVYAPRESNFDG